MERTVMVVDDLAANRRIIKEMLGDAYHVIEASNGQEAMDILHREHREISAVLLDIGLPGIDGYGVLKSIRLDKRFSKMPVIMITADTEEAARAKSLRLGANDFMRKPYNSEILLHCLENNIVRSESAQPRSGPGEASKRRPTLNLAVSFRSMAIAACALSLVVSLCVRHATIQGELGTTGQNVADGFTEIMHSYLHSFELFELLIQREIESGRSPDEIETFLKERDRRLLEIEGADYDGVYLYYQGRYLYSWDTPYSVYEESGYDATTRPWYIGAVEAKGALFFSTPYPSYANNYMLATISRLQPDGETVIAYDIKLGEIGKFVDKLSLHKGAVALICDTDGNIIGSTNNLYLGGNYTWTDQQLDQAFAAAQQRVEASSSKDPSAEAAYESAEAQRQFITRERQHLLDLLSQQKTLRYSLPNLSFGYAYANDAYTCFVVAPIVTVIPQVVNLWAALSVVLISLAFLIDRIARKNRQILSDTLTGLNNRRAFIKYCDNHILHHGEELLGLLMLDLNQFKQINDLYGHAVGDQALQDTAAVLKGACAASPDNYFLCRYGGDEFLLAARVPDTAALECMKELIVDGFGRKNQTSMTPYVLEASMGALCGICRDKKDVENLLTLADQAMYNDKRMCGGGRH